MEMGSGGGWGQHRGRGGGQWMEMGWCCLKVFFIFLVFLERESVCVCERREAGDCRIMAWNEKDCFTKRR